MPSRSRAIPPVVLFALVALIAIGSIAGALLASALPGMLVAAFMVFLAWNGRRDAGASTAASVLTMLLVVAVTSPLLAITGLPLSTTAGATWCVVALVALGVRAGSARAIGRPSAPVAILFAAAAIVPAIAVGTAVATVIRSGGTRIAWAMGNDAVWNTVAARFIVADGGLAPSVHPNPAPLANEVMALLMAPGRDGVAPAALLEHDVAREIQGLLVMTIVAGVLASVLVGGAVPPHRRLLRPAVAILAGCLPWTWFLSGVAFQLGFYNVLLGTVALFALWSCWLGFRERPLAGFALMMGAATVVLAVWAPLVVIPLAMAGWIAFRWLRAARRTRATPGGAGVAVLAVGQFLAYAVLITIPDLRRDGGALADDGAMVALQPAGLIAGVLAVWIVVILTVGAPDGRRRLIGVALVTAAAAAGIGYLVVQRAAATSGWGYYPAKFGWFVLILAVLIVSHAVAERMPSVEVPFGSVVSPIAVLAAVGIVLLQIPPAGFGPTSIVPALGIVRSENEASPDTRASELFQNSDASTKQLFARYFADADTERFVNGWLLQQSASASSDPIRTFAYFLDPADATQLCDAVSTWGDEVVIATRDPGLEAELRAACPDSDVVVRLAGPPESEATRG